MSDRPIRHILCAVRSKPGGENTVIRAIDLAREHRARLTFFKVIDDRFLSKFRASSTSRSVVIRPARRPQTV